MGGPEEFLGKMGIKKGGGEMLKKTWCLIIIKVVDFIAPSLFQTSFCEKKAKDKINSKH